MIDLLICFIPQLFLVSVVLVKREIREQGPMLVFNFCLDLDPVKPDLEVALLIVNIRSTLVKCLV